MPTYVLLGHVFGPSPVHHEKLGLGLGLGFDLLMSFVSDVLGLVLSKLFFGFWEMMNARDKGGCGVLLEKKIAGLRNSGLIC